MKLYLLKNLPSFVVQIIVKCYFENIKLNNGWFLQMNIERCYHGTTFGNAKRIMKNGFLLGKIPGKNNIIGRKNYNPGSLGLGIYCFVDDYISGVLFTKRRNSWTKERLAVLGFEIESNDYILDFTDINTIKIFRAFWSKTSQVIKTLRSKYNNDGFASKLDGAILDLFIIWLVKNKKVDKIQGIYKLSQNNLTDVNIYITGLPNSAELCIKDNEVIKKSSMYYEIID